MSVDRRLVLMQHQFRARRCATANAWRSAMVNPCARYVSAPHLPHAVAASSSELYET